MASSLHVRLKSVFYKSENKVGRGNPLCILQELTSPSLVGRSSCTETLVSAYIQTATTEPAQCFTEPVPYLE